MRSDSVREYFREAQRRRRQNPAARKVDCDYQKDKYHKNRKKMLAANHIRRMNRYHEDSEFRLKECMRARTRLAMKGEIKTGTTFALIGCSVSDLRSHLEAQFKPGMSWKNYGQWEVDHIKPCAAFDLRHPSQQKECFHFSNLQPLWRRENLEKGDKIEARLRTPKLALF